MLHVDFTGDLCFGVGDFLHTRLHRRRPVQLSFLHFKSWVDCWDKRTRLPGLARDSFHEGLVREGEPRLSEGNPNLTQFTVVCEQLN